MLKPRRFSAPRGNARESILSLDSVSIQGHWSFSIEIPGQCMQGYHWSLSWVSLAWGSVITIIFSNTKLLSCCVIVYTMIKRARYCIHAYFSASQNPGSYLRNNIIKSQTYKCTVHLFASEEEDDELMYFKKLKTN